MDKAEFNARWNKAFTAKGLQELIYKAPHSSGMSRDKVLKEQQKKYGKNHKNIIRENAKRYYQRHKEEGKAYSKEYRKKNIEWVRERNRRYREKHREELREKARAYYYKRKQMLLTENDEPTRAEEELKRFTSEERRAFEEWETQNKKRIVC